MKFELEHIRTELARPGIEVKCISDLYNYDVNYKAAIPLLIEWLPLVHDLKLKEEIVRALSVKWAKPVAARPLILEFKNIEAGAELGIRWAIANALAVVADDSVFSEIELLALDRKYGRSREMLALALGNMKAEESKAVRTLLHLLEDEQMTAHSLLALKRLRPKGIKKYVEPFLDHPRKLVRRNARSLLKVISA